MTFHKMSQARDVYSGYVERLERIFKEIIPGLSPPLKYGILNEVEEIRRLIADFSTYDIEKITQDELIDLLTKAVITDAVLKIVVGE